MSTERRLHPPTVDAWFYWTIYGWTHPEYTYCGTHAQGLEQASL